MHRLRSALSHGPALGARAKTQLCGLQCHGGEIRDYGWQFRDGLGWKGQDPFRIGRCGGEGHFSLSRVIDVFWKVSRDLYRQAVFRSSLNLWQRVVFREMHAVEPISKPLGRLLH